MENGCHITHLNTHLKISITVYAEGETIGEKFTVKERWGYKLIMFFTHLKKLHVYKCSTMCL